MATIVSTIDFDYPEHLLGHFRALAGVMHDYQKPTVYRDQNGDLVMDRLIVNDTYVVAWMWQFADEFGAYIADVKFASRRQMFPDNVELVASITKQNFDYLFRIWVFGIIPTNVLKSTMDDMRAVWRDSLARMN